MYKTNPIWKGLRRSIPALLVCCLAAAPIFSAGVTPKPGPTTRPGATGKPAATPKPGPTAKPDATLDEAKTSLNTAAKEILGGRLEKCQVDPYPGEPAKRQVRLNVTTPTDDVKRCEQEAGLLFKAMFTSRFSVKLVSVFFYNNTSKLVYQIVLSDKEANKLNWNNVANIDFGSIAKYIWPLPDDSCSGFGTL